MHHDFDKSTMVNHDLARSTMITATFEQWAANQIYHVFIDFSWKLSSIRVSLFYYDCFKLSKTCDLNLRATRDHNILHVSLKSGSIFICCWHFLNFTAILLQIDSSHVTTFKVASYSACSLTNGDSIG